MKRRLLSLRLLLLAALVGCHEPASDSADAAFDRPQDVAVEVASDGPQDSVADEEGARRDVAADVTTDVAADVTTDVAADVTADLTDDVTPRADSSPDSEADVGGDVVADAVGDAPSDGGAPGRSRCPSTSPTYLSPCPVAGLECMYGGFGEYRPLCRSWSSCNLGNAWDTGGGGACTSFNGYAGACSGPEADALAGGACPLGSGVGGGLYHCTYPSRLCECDGRHFQCDDPTSVPGCPPHLPRFGADCPAEGLRCTYGVRGFSTYGSAVCRSFGWTFVNPP